MQVGPIKQRYGYFSAFAPTKQLLLFMVVFGVLGGGYFVFKSFAATVVRYHDGITYERESLPPYPVKVEDIIRINGSKRKVTVWQLPGNSSVYAGIRFFDASRSKSVRACITSHRAGADVDFPYQVTLQTTPSARTTYNLQGSSTWDTRCTGPVLVRGDDLKAVIKNTNQVNLNVYSVSFEY